MNSISLDYLKLIMAHSKIPTYKILVSCVSLFLFFSALPVSFAADDLNQDQEYSLRHQLRKRSYLVHLPPSYKPGVPTPLVLNFHGGGGTAEGQIASTQMDATSDKYGFIVVYPQGSARLIVRNKLGTWNAGHCCGFARDHKIDDVGFVNKMLDELERKFSIDSKRVYATGLSNGAQMSYRLACELSNRIAAIAPVSSISVLDECHPARNVPVIHFHGTADPTSFYAGGMCGGAYDKWLGALGFGSGEPKATSLWKCKAVSDFISDWKNQNGCGSALETIYQNGNAACVQYVGCQDGADVALCSIQGAGHTWPGGQYGPVCDRPNSKLCRTFMDVVGPLNDDMSANEVMWEFFKKHPLK